MSDAAQTAGAWERWQELTRGISNDFETKLSGPPSSFRGSMQRYSAMGLRCLNIETNARSLARRKSAANSDDRHYCLVYQARGRSMVVQGAHCAMLNPADMVLVSPDEDCTFVNRGAIRHLSFHIPEQELFKAFNTDRVALAIPIRSRTSVGSLLSALLLQVHSRSTELTAITCKGLETAMASLMAPLAEEGHAREDIDDDSPNVVSVMTILRFVDSNLRNPNLAPGYVARSLGCSARHVHRAFEGRSFSLSGYIKHQRLLKSAAELVAAETRSDSITEIALRWGFSDISHFSRSFRAKYGIAPREYRERGVELPTMGAS